MKIIKLSKKNQKIYDELGSKLVELGFNKFSTTYTKFVRRDEISIYLLNKDKVEYLYRCYPLKEGWEAFTFDIDDNLIANIIKKVK